MLPFTLPFKILVISDRLNFTLNLTLTEKEKWGVFRENGSSTGALGMIIKGEADFTIGKFALTSLRNVYMTPSMSYYSSPLIIVVPHGEPFTSLEKLTKPFRETIWTLVMAILLIALSAIAILKWKFNGIVQNFVFGERNASPYLNTLSVTLGGSLTQLPSGNFARTILCIFMLYCLIVRNSYTGALYRFIRTDSLRKPTVDSIDEMVEKDFKFYMIPQAAEFTTDIPKLYTRRQVINPSDVQSIRAKMTQPSFKGGMLSSLEQIVYFNMINRKHFTVNVCKERLFTFQYSIYFHKKSFLVHNFDLEILDYQANGLIANVVEKYVHSRFLRPVRSKKGPKALQLSQVMGSFWLLSFGLIISFTVAVIECCYKSFS
jgi:hypothetical protein